MRLQSFSFFPPAQVKAKRRTSLKEIEKQKNKMPLCKSRFLSDPPAVLSHTCQHFFLHSGFGSSLYLCIRLLSAFCSHWLCPRSTCGNNRNLPYLYSRPCPAPTVASWEMQSFTLGVYVTIWIRIEESRRTLQFRKNRFLGPRH